MARTNGPIQVWSRSDTIPTDSEGGFAGGDSTAAAVGTSLDQSSKALGTVDNLAVTASTLDYGQEATATISGTSPWKTIHVGIPKGMSDDVGQQLVTDAQTSADAAAQSAADAELALQAQFLTQDEGVATLIEDDTAGPKTRAALDGTYATRRLGLAATRTTLAAVTPSATAPTPLASFDGYAWGHYSGTIYRSSDGRTWSAYCPAPGSPRNLLPCADGEVIAVQFGSVQKSSGWAGGAPTWATKVTVNGTANYHAGSVSGDGVKFIAAQYGPGTGTGSQGYTDSRYAHVSVDGGDTWTLAYDSVALHGATAANASHVHSAAYDPWSDRFYVAEGHGAAIAGIYFSSDDGATWTRPAGLTINPPPTVMVPTDDGMVCGSDHAHGGVEGFVRQADAADEVISRTWGWERGEDGVVGFGTQGHRDPSTGVVYIAFRSGKTTMPPIIAGGTAAVAGLVYEYPAASVAAQDAITQVVVHGDTLLAAATVNGVTSTLTGRVAAPGAYTPPELITGTNVHLGGGSSINADSGGASTLRRTALGGGARADYDNSTAVGAAAFAGDGGTNSVAVGANAHASSSAVAVGEGANASVFGATALGQGATASHSGSVAFGRASATNATNQFQAGARHIELSVPGSAPPLPLAGACRIVVEKNANNQDELRVLFNGTNGRVPLAVQGAHKVPAYATGSRPYAPTMAPGAMIFDTTLGKPLWCTGSAWVDATGATA